MYRSFVTCDDPKGVVECGTFRRSKSLLERMEEDTIRSHRTQKNSNASSAAHKGKKEEMVSKGNAEDHHTPSSFQLREVSKGAQKLNHLIHSWSKGLTYDTQPKDIAKDLLKGALDLQESLTMLGKLQEASQYMAQLKRKQKEKLERGRIDEWGSVRMNSCRFGDQHEQLGFQNPRLSADGYSRDCIEELRNAIKAGLARQSSLRNASSQDKIKFESRKVGSVSHIPSSSSSQLLTVHSDHSHSAGSSSSQTVSQKKGRSPNLIAKLMGLDDIPSKSMLQSPSKLLDAEKNLSQQRGVFDIEMPKLKKPQPTLQKVDSQHRTLEEILETVQFQGLLKSKSAKEFYAKSYQSTDFHDKQSFDELPPIVLIKPRRVSRTRSEEMPAPIVWEEEALSREMMTRKTSVKEVVAHGSINDKRVTINSNNICCGPRGEETPMERIIQEEGAKDCIKELVIPVDTEVRTIDQNEGTVNVNKVQRKVKAKQAPVKNYSHEGANDTKEIEIRTEEKEVKIDRKVGVRDVSKVHRKLRTEQSPTKSLVIEEGAKTNKELEVRGEEKEVKKKLKDSTKKKDSNLASSQQQQKEKTNKVQKAVASSRKQVAEKEIMKSKIVSRSLDQPTPTFMKLRKSDDHASQQPISIRKTISKHTTQNTIHSYKVRKQKDKQVTEDLSAKPSIAYSECKEEIKGIDDLSSNNHSQKEEHTTIVVEQPSIGEQTNAAELQTEEHCDDSQDSLCIGTMPTEFSEEADEQMTHISIDCTSFKTENRLKNLLFSSVSFLNFAEEAFDLNPSYPTQTCRIHDTGEMDAKLWLDYANEYIERRSLQDSETRHPVICYMGSSRIYISVDQLVEEICGAVESLRSYKKLGCDTLGGDSSYVTLERDLRSREVVSRIWDLGWRKGCSLDEVEQTINELEKLLVSELIEEFV